MPSSGTMSMDPIRECADWDMVGCLQARSLVFTPLKKKKEKKKVLVTVESFIFSTSYSVRCLVSRLDSESR